ncbi:MAG: metal-dependent hydrolase [Lachnospiraceae bacterium]|nr:metal-dependent hydrolase [Lachnospiraceae bacterium]
MTAPTHKQYSVTFAFITCIIVFLTDITSINYYLMLVIMLMASKYGALFPDIDHSWQNVKEKTVPNWILNKLIHLTGGKHRSWQTHSIDIVVIFTVLSYIIPHKLYDNKIIDYINLELILIVLIGFCSGWISHIFADMWTSAGVRLFCFSKKKLAFVPKRIGSLEFKTGEAWEEFCFKTVKFINVFLGLASVLFPLIYDGTLNNLIYRLISFLGINS